ARRGPLPLRRRATRRPLHLRARSGVAAPRLDPLVRDRAVRERITRPSGLRGGAGATAPAAPRRFLASPPRSAAPAPPRVTGGAYLPSTRQPARASASAMTSPSACAQGGESRCRRALCAFRPP